MPRKAAALGEAVKDALGMGQSAQGRLSPPSLGLEWGQCPEQKCPTVQQDPKGGTRPSKPRGQASAGTLLHCFTRIQGEEPF